MDGWEIDVVCFPHNAEPPASLISRLQTFHSQGTLRRRHFFLLYPSISTLDQTWLLAFPVAGGYILERRGISTSGSMLFGGRVFRVLAFWGVRGSFIDYGSLGAKRQAHLIPSLLRFVTRFHICEQHKPKRQRSKTRLVA